MSMTKTSIQKLTLEKSGSRLSWQLCIQAGKKDSEEIQNRYAITTDILISQVLTFFQDKRNYINNQKMQDLGTWLCKSIFPSPLINQLCALDNGILIFSVPLEWAQVPFELCFLPTKGFIGNILQLGTVLQAQDQTQTPGIRQTLPTTKFLIISNPQSSLSQATKEVSELQKIAENYQVEYTLLVAQHTNEILGEIEKSSLVHFAGHSSLNDSPNQTGWEIGTETLFSLKHIEQIKHFPVIPWLVFSNSCFAGDSGDGVTAQGVSWVFHHCGVSQFVGPIIDINDLHAQHYALLFYKYLFLHYSVAESLLKARQEFYQTYPKSCSPLFYRLFGNPVAHVSPDGTVLRKVALHSRTTLPKCNKLAQNHYLPYDSLESKFIGRTNEIWALHDIIISKSSSFLDGVCVLEGIGGIGKTRLAIEYAYRFATNYPGGIFWIDFHKGIEPLISQLLPNYNLREINKINPETSLKQLWKTINNLGPSLIIYDDFPEYEEKTNQWIPIYNSIYTIITTRRRDLPYSKLWIKPLDFHDSLKLLILKGEKEVTEFHELATLLEGHPGALNKIIKYMNSDSDLSVDDIIKILKMGNQNYSENKHTMINETTKLYNQLEISSFFDRNYIHLSGLAKEILHILAYSYPHNLSLKKLGDMLGTNYTEPSLSDPIQEAMSELYKYSLIEIKNGKTIKISYILMFHIKNISDDPSRYFTKRNH